jgi:NAD(P)-dependent dehydrogenase (short-subunit alcohol dehydrogenase family)
VLNGRDDKVENVMGTLIITGASRGIGAAVARLAAKQYSIVVNYLRDGAAAAEVVREITSAGGRAVAIQGDVGIEEDALRLFAQAEKQVGPVRALVNNAGITGGFSRVENITSETLERVFAANVTGTILCSREAVRRMFLRRPQISAGPANGFTTPHRKARLTVLRSDWRVKLRRKEFV